MLVLHLFGIVTCCGMKQSESVGSPLGYSTLASFSRASTSRDTSKLITLYFHSPGIFSGQTKGVHIFHSDCLAMNLKTDYLLAAVPLAFPVGHLVTLLDNPVPVVGRWLRMLISSHSFENDSPNEPSIPPVGSQLLAYVVVATFGFAVTNHLVPNIKVGSLVGFKSRKQNLLFLKHFLTCLCIIT